MSPRWSFALVGLVLGAIDTASLRALGVTMRTAEGGDLTWAVLALFGVSFALLGHVTGRLVEARQRIARQLAQLERTQDELLRNERLAALGRMAASVAHEVRNPLAVIRSSAALIAEAGVAPADRARATSFIVDEVDRLDAYVERILAHGRPLEPRLAPVELAEAAARAARLAGVEAMVAIDGGARVEADDDLLTRLLAGLLTNAAEAGAGAIRLRVRDAPEGAPARVRVDVSDDGPGVDPALRDQLFLPFVTGKARGTGLGLALARRIARAHGGDLVLAATPDGDAFRLELPR